MATKIMLNGVEVMSDAQFEVSRLAIAQILTTANPLVDGVSSALQAVPNGAAALLENVSKGKMSDVITVEEKPQGADKWIPTRESTREILVNRLTLAINRAKYAVTVLDKNTTKAVKEIVPQATGGF